MNYIIFDLEATCWENRDQSPNEIIEIGAVKINAEGTTVDEFQAFVKPTVHPTLSDFCTRLTSITQQHVDQAPTFDQAIQLFKDWIGVDQLPYLLCSWGFYDRRQLREDSDRFGLDKKWINKHISVKHQHHKLAGTEQPMGMDEALKLEGFPLQGTHHRGIDDARNIARIFQQYFGQWQ